jgi:thermitase
MQKPKLKIKNHFTMLVSSFLIFSLTGAGCSSDFFKDKKEGERAPTLSDDRHSRIQKKSPSVIPGELLVQLRDQSQLEEYGARFEIVSIHPETHVYLFRDPAMSGEEDRFLEELEQSGDFSIVERNALTEIKSSIPRDPNWLDLWALKNYGQDAPNGAEGVKGADIQALDAWKVTRGSREIIVAVIDTGIDYRHPDLAENIWVNEAERDGLPGVDDDGNGYVDDVHGWNFVSKLRKSSYYGQLGHPDPMDDQGHGTHVAGTIGAVGNNQEGIAGVNWKVRLMGLKFLDEKGSGSTADQYRALLYAAENGADIINASYGGGGKSRLIQSAIERLNDAGVLMVAAAGNNGSNNDESPQYPSNYGLPNMLSVAATNNRDRLASFSNYGYESVHIAAPGVAILSTYPLELSKTAGGYAEPYRAFSGTSMAAPHVAGAAALVLSVRPELRRNPELLKEAL